ncbi:MAG: lytic transglycosylase domain-containing protein [Candidatus Binatia bacterium]|nr:lytic transglycosylase domain-containing protein [Candidatus Binatia bacterium]MDG2011560.1 lytic transglycosylase domain-containing protein [Candidatus Binatia bacterium]
MKLHQALFGFLLCCSCSTAEEASLQELPLPVEVVPAVVVEVPSLPILSHPVQKRVAYANRTVGALRDHPAVVAQAHDLARDSWTVRVGLRRADAFFAMIEEQLVHHNVPRELAFVPMVESVFHPEARGRRAVGLWQFTKATAQAYGLRVDGQLDERRDPVKSTAAAIQYLRHLHDRFGSWELALAAYNAGPSRVRRAMRARPGASFWELSEAKLLPPVTRRYVPKVIGSALLADDPERFGLRLPEGLAAVAFSRTS